MCRLLPGFVTCWVASDISIFLYAFLNDTSLSLFHPSRLAFFMFRFLASVFHSMLQINPGFRSKLAWNVLACIYSLSAASSLSILCSLGHVLACICFLWCLHSFHLLASICLFIACLHTRFLLCKCSCNLLCCFLASAHAVARWLSCFVSLLVAWIFQLVCCFIFSFLVACVLRYLFLPSHCLSGSSVVYFSFVFLPYQFTCVNN